MIRTMIVFAGFAALLLPVLGFGQGRTTSYGKVRITPEEFVHRGDSVYVELALSLSGARVGRRMSLELIPVLTDGDRSRALPVVRVCGRRNYKEYRRQMSMMSKKDQARYVAPYAVEKGYGNEGSVHYRYSVPYEQWMGVSRLDARTELCGCGQVRSVLVEPLSDRVSTDRLPVWEPYRPVPHFAFAEPSATSVKHRELSGAASLVFALAKTDLREDLGDNASELSRICGMIGASLGDQSVTIWGIDITGYASPEGSLSLNRRLSEGRAKALCDYLQGRYDIGRELYSVHFGGEDWSGLMESIESTDLPYKDEVLSVIGSVDLLDVRESRLKTLGGGVPYRYMLREMFPSLRRVVCKIDYEIKNYDVDEASEVIQSHPEKLSMGEMYAVANTYEPGSAAFCDVLEISVRTYPEDPVANLNAAVAALMRKDLVSAERYLSHVVSGVRIPEYDNAVGVLWLLRGDYDKAEGCFRMASEAGLSVAESNLAEIAKKREDMARGQVNTQ